MTRKPLLSLGAVGAALALAAPQAALAQDCVSQDDVSDGVVYAMPHLLDAFSTKCGETLASTGFLASEGDELRARFAAYQDDTWPGAFSAIGKFADQGRAPGGARDNAFVSTLGGLPEESVRPFIDAMIVQKMTEVIPLKECTNIERGISLFAPLPIGNWGEIAAFLFDMAGVRNPQICDYEPSDTVGE